MPNPLSGPAAHFKTALVTGASSGIGEAIATRFLKAGLTVYGTSRHPQSQDGSSGIKWLPFNGTTEEGIASFVSEQIDLLTTVDVLVNNAGSSSFGKSESIPQSASIAQKNLLLKAPIELSKVVLQGMESRRSGAIVNISSLAALFPLPYMASYSESKAALSAFSQGLMAEWEQSDIIVIDFQAGDFHTAFNKNIIRYGEMDADQEKVWKRLEENLAKAPPPEKAAEDLLRALSAGHSRTVRSGGFFQSRMAPLGARILPESVIKSMIRRYYNLPW